MYRNLEAGRNRISWLQDRKAIAQTTIQIFLQKNDKSRITKSCSTDARSSLPLAAVSVGCVHLHAVEQVQDMEQHKTFSVCVHCRQGSSTSARALILATDLRKSRVVRSNTCGGCRTRTLSDPASAMRSGRTEIMRGAPDGGKQQYCNVLLQKVFCSAPLGIDPQFADAIHQDFCIQALARKHRHWGHARPPPPLLSASLGCRIRF